MPAGKAVMKLNEAAEPMSEIIVSEDSESAFYADYFTRMFQELRNRDAESLRHKESLAEELRKKT